MVNVILVLAGAVFGSMLLFLMIVLSVFIAATLKKEKKYRAYTPCVSIIIPAYNEEATIRECLDSVLKLDYPKHKTEIIVVDDGSDDRTADIARAYGKHSVKLIKTGHKGKPAALNAGIKKARYNILFTVDADTALDKRCLAEIVKPFADRTIAATTANCRVKNKSSLLGLFQNIEYHYNNLVSNSFSKAFSQGSWFFGAIACYRKDALQRIGLFKNVFAEDMQAALEIARSGYKVMNVNGAIGYTYVPESIKELYRQRYRWSIGGIQAVVKNRKAFSRQTSPSTYFLGFTQFWGPIYSLLCLPIIAYLVAYWLPYNSSSFMSLFLYLFRWFSVTGIFYVIYKISAWGIAYYTLFGILTGIVSTAMILSALHIYKDRSIRNLVAIFFYFPYTILLNSIIIISVARSLASRNSLLRAARRE
ncbi:glycosyltransferase family 2 protein [Candidatus Woesearchaeota archaeon]|nr:glycosyltransferase family 2 protein [Candidatus Woesearchaeota archaeon]